MAGVAVQQQGLQHQPPLPQLALRLGHLLQVSLHCYMATLNVPLLPLLVIYSVGLAGRQFFSRGPAWRVGPIWVHLDMASPPRYLPRWVLWFILLSFWHHCLFWRSRGWTWRPTRWRSRSCWLGWSPGWNFCSCFIEVENDFSLQCYPGCGSGWCWILWPSKEDGSNQRTFFVIRFSY